MFDDLDGLSDASGVPCVDGCDELGCLPVDLVVLDVRVLDDGGLLKISSAAVCSVFLYRYIQFRVCLKLFAYSLVPFDMFNLRAQFCSVQIERACTSKCRYWIIMIPLFPPYCWTSCEPLNWKFCIAIFGKQLNVHVTLAMTDKAWWHVWHQRAVHVKVECIVKWEVRKFNLRAQFCSAQVWSLRTLPLCAQQYHHPLCKYTK